MNSSPPDSDVPAIDPLRPAPSDATVDVSIGVSAKLTEGQPEQNTEAPEPSSSIPDSTSNIQNSPSGSSYGQVLRSSSIIGGSSGINYIIGMVRTKVVAVLLGPSGVGLVGLYVSITGLVSTIAQLGLNQSGVREVAEANSSGDSERVARVAKTLRRVCWLTGIFGWLLTVAFAWPLSRWVFGSSERAWAVAILGVTVLIGAVAGGQSATLQGMRRIGDLARIQVCSAIVTTLVAVGLYAWLGEKGIIPVIILTAFSQLVFSWYFVRRIQISNVPQSWLETAKNSKRLVSLGAAFMYGAVLAAIVGVTIRSIIVRDLGLDANGIYQAVWSLSGMFAGFILGAMGTDFYPRLTAVAHDDERVNRLVNEQTEIGILLALPGLLGTLAFAPWVIHLLYSSKFLPGAALLPWFLIGVFGQVVSWPFGMIQMAKGATKWIYFGRTEGNLLQLGLTILLMKNWGLTGAALAFAIFAVIHGCVTFCIARRLTKFAWSQDVVRLVLYVVGIVGVAFISQYSENSLLKIVIGVFLTGLACLFSFRGLALRLGEGHRIIKMVLKFPGGRFVCGR